MDTPAGYHAWLAELKTRIREARLRASLAVNAELIGLYWQTGREILERQGRDGWGARVVDRLAVDLRAEFPGMRGFSRANPPTCGPSPRWWLIRQLCNGSLEDCRGARISGC